MSHRDAGRLLEPTEIDGVLRSLTVLDLDVERMHRFVPNARELVPGDALICIIDIVCCVIDCSCSASDLEIYENPASRLRGFTFRLREQADSPDAPVYFLAETQMPEALRLGHQALRAPGNALEARVLGLAGEVLGADTLAEAGIAPTAPVIQLAPKPRHR